MAKCPVCGSEATAHPTQGDRQQYTCGVCGSFEITGTAERILETNQIWTPVKRAVLSNRIRLDQGHDSPPRIDSYLMDRIADGGIKLPTPPQQAANLLRMIGDRVLETGHPLFKLPSGLHAEVGAPSWRAAEELVFELHDQGLIKGIIKRASPGGLFQNIEPSLAGWNSYEREVTGKRAGKVAIIAMKFKDPELDAFVEAVVKPAVVEAGFELERISDRPRAGVIDQIMRVKIRDAPFLLADLSHDNCGAYWEAGFAEGLGKPVIYLCHSSKWDTTRTHFDTNHCETIDWHPEQAELFRERLVATIRNSMADR